MTSEVVTVDQDQTVQSVCRIMSDKEVGSVVILKDASPVGIVTERDFLRRILAADRDPKNTKIGEIMSSPVVSVSPDSNVLDALSLMKERNFRRLVVMDQHKLVGIVTLADLSRYLAYFYSRVW